MWVAFIFIALLVVLILLVAKGKQEDKEKGIIGRAIGLRVVQGIPGMLEGQIANLVLYQDKIIVNGKQTIPLSRVKEAVCFTQKDIIEKNKSVVGRAIVGTALLGPLGGIVGGMSGIGKKAKSTQIEFLAIHYTDKDGNDETAVFKKEGANLLFSFVNKVNKQIGFEAKLPDQPYEI